MRVKRVFLSPIVFTNLLTMGEIKIRCIKGLPEGAKFCYIIHQADRLYIEAVFEHESFELLNDGDLIPILETQFERIES